MSTQNFNCQQLKSSMQSPPAGSVRGTRNLPNFERRGPECLSARTTLTAPPPASLQFRPVSNFVRCHRRPLIANTDQGSQFTSEAYLDAVESAGVDVSMDGRGRWMDKRFIERLWRSVKQEDIYRQPGYPRRRHEPLHLNSR